MSIFHGNKSRIAKSLGYNTYGVGIRVHNRDYERSIDNYFKRGKGELDIKMIERDSDYGVFELTMNSKTMDKPITTQIETRIDGLQSIDKPMELVNQVTDFLQEATKDIFVKSRGAKAVLSPDNRSNDIKKDFIKMEAMATKVQEKISNALTYGCELSNKMDKEKVQDYKAKNQNNLSYSLNFRPAM
ncbi:hypothetical protein [Billgrantia endophytica]|uniref:Uncharacterized protein n=1 Tax=Billgrantia endophytica TaxID=2033802 RepID=A0A2N7TUC3_9GAMM|nr:hypothetical protein [Halomonas endophytica]PMR71783.1 hypothetical protein C1H69_22890 [Halomonas endophytica]